MVTLRRAVLQDAPSLAVFAERTFREAFAERNSPENMDAHCAKAFGTGIQRREMEDPWLVTMLAEDGGRPVGFSQLRVSNASPNVSASRPAERLRRLAGPRRRTGADAAGHR
jgi:hypothetical protein